MGPVSDTSTGSPEAGENAEHRGEQHHGDVGGRLNWLRAGVLGANDGIVSTAGLVMGVAGATSDRTTIFTAGAAGLVAGALSMAGGEYVSVSTQRDTEQALLEKERWELKHLPEQELEELAELYEERGLTPELAREVARQLTDKDALSAHAEVELGIDPDALTSPWQAAWASLVSFTVGALLPLIVILLPPPSVRAWLCVGAVAVALAITGATSAWLGSAHRRPAVVRNVAVGLLAMGVTYFVGTLVGGATG
ncbi:VIT family protein [Spongisporangium articulatum]|uniref:VIT family protein n=1 Tax=Spongisporangium articulatum TaxID=3362603 RepID=A0ABW8AQA6_9ACTN